jgi:single-stranded-DNA-specific exonuclease
LACDEVLTKKWTTYKKKYDNVDSIIGTFGIPEIVARALINRDIDTVSKVNRFLNAGLEELYDPYRLKGIEEAVCRIKSAVEKKEKICIYGDYDVDGITSTVILIKVLHFLGAEPIYYIPKRKEEGYGLNLESIEKLHEQDVRLIVTVDCGIRAIDVVKYANTLKIDVIISDHHECEDSLPDAHSIINPHQPGCEYPFKYLAGVGVAFKLACALLSNKEDKELKKEMIEIASIGTIADVVPIIDENRIIVKKGLEYIKSTANKGIRSLLEVSGLYNKEVNAYNIAFMIAPRINAAGRIADADKCVELLLTDNQSNAMKIAEKLDKDNRERQAIENDILMDAILKIEKSVDFESDKVIVLGSEKWHSGVIGIVASKLVERFYMPAMLISIQDGIGKGSGRSIPQFNLYNAMVTCSDLFEKFGGHELAAGFTIKSDNIGKLRERMNMIADEVLGKEKPLPEILVDYKLTSKDINLDTVRMLKVLEPYGAGNPSPLYVYRDLKVLSAKAIGNEGKHLLLNVYDGKNSIRCIGFNLGHYQKLLSTGSKIDIICSMEENSWNNIKSIQLNIKDIKIR